MSDDFFNLTHTEQSTRPSPLDVTAHQDLQDTGIQIAKTRKANYKFNLFKNRWLVSILVVALFATFCYAIVGLPYYETNDDIVMTAIVSGTGILERPDEHMIWSNVYLGLALKHLYFSFPSIPWYGIFQVATVFASTSVVTWLAFGKSNRPIMAIGLAASVLLIACIRPLVLMQFTTSSALAASAGALLLIESVERWHLRKRSVACAICAALMFALSTLIRGNSATIVVIVTTMIIVSRFTPMLVRRWREMLAQLTAVFLAFAIIWSGNLANERYYQGEWKDAYKTLRATASIREYRCDRIDSPLRPLMYQQVGWTPTDSTLFLNWYGLNTNTYSAEKLVALSKAMKDNLLKTFDSNRALSTVQNLLLDPMFTILVLPLILIVPLLNRTKIPIATTVLLSIGIFALCAYFILCMKLPMRVFVAVIMPLTFFAFRYISISKLTSPFSRDAASTNRTFSHTVYGIILLAALAPSLWQISLMQTHLKSMAKLEDRTQAALRSLLPQPNQLYVCWAANPRIIVSPFADLRQIFHNFNAIPIGAVGPAPFVMKRLQNAGITDLLGQLDKENIFLISNEQYNRFIRMHAAEKLGKEVVFERVPVYPRVFECFKVKYIAPAAPDKLKRDLSVAFLTEQQPDKQPEAQKSHDQPSSASKSLQGSIE